MNLRFGWWVLLSVACLLFAGPSMSAPQTDTVARDADQPVALRAAFSQERLVPGFRNALRSEGRMLLVRGVGLAWETEKPFPSTLIVRSDGLFVRQEDGALHALGQGTQGSVPALIQSLMDAVLAGDRVALAERFVVQEKEAEQGSWHLALTPKPGPLAKLFKSVEIHGATHVEWVNLLDMQGAVTRIRFSGTTLGAAGAAERLELE